MWARARTVSRLGLGSGLELAAAVAALFLLVLVDARPQHLLLLILLLLIRERRRPAVALVVSDLEHPALDVKVVILNTEAIAVLVEARPLHAVDDVCDAVLLRSRRLRRGAPGP